MASNQQQTAPVSYSQTYSQYADPAKQQQAIQDQYSNMRTGLLASKAATTQQTNQGLDRSAEAAGGIGGAAMKAKSNATQQIGEQYGAQIAQTGAQQAQAQQQFGAQQQSAETQQQQFGAQYGLSQKQLSLAKDQFNFAKSSWTAEFYESKKNDFINSFTALRNSGIPDDPTYYQRIIDTLNNQGVHTTYNITGNVRAGAPGITNRGTGMS